MRQLQTLIIIYFCYLSTAFAQPVITGTHEVSAFNEVVSITVSVQHFTDILRMRYSVNWDPTQLEFLTLTQIGGINSLTINDFDFSGSAIGHFVMDWSDNNPGGTSLPDHTQLYKMNFLVHGGPGTCADVSFSNTPTQVYVQRLSTGTINIGLDREHGKVIIPQAPCRVEDSLALVDLYNQTNGRAWFNSWDLSQPIHTWDGVIISPITGCVETVDLDGISDGRYSPNGNGRNLTGTLPDLVLPNIKKFYLSHNLLTGNIPNFTYTSNLENLTLDNNQFSFSPSLGSMSVLSELFVQENQLTFDDVVSNMTTVNTSYVYAEQAWIHSPSTATVLPGSFYTIDLEIDPNMTDNIYHWFKDGINLQTIIGDNKLNLTNITSSDAGVYTCEVSNVQAPELTLFSHPVTIVLDCVPDGTNLTEQICEGAVYEMGGVEYSTTGFYESTLQNRIGCDSLVQLSLTVMPSSETNLNEQICEGESITIGNQEYRTTGFYQNILETTLGCDSLVNLNLMVTSHETTNLVATICEGQTYSVGTSIYDETGDYENHFVTTMGCDSTVYLSLTVSDFSETFLTENICEGDSYSVGTSTYTTSGNYEDMLVTESGCDSMVHLQLEVVEILEETLTVTVCNGDSYAIGTTSYDETGNYEGVLMSTIGCDSMVFLNLIVADVVMTDLEASICEGGTYTVGTSSYTEPGTYQDVLTTVDGCDSLVHLDLRLTTTLETNLDIQICEGSTYTVGQNTYHETGNYENTLTGTSGCDSIVYLFLQVNNVIETHLEKSFCEGGIFTLGNTDYSETGNYQANFTTPSGCDSTVYLNLEILTPVEKSETVTICIGESYAIGSNNYTETGHYTANLSTTSGCDSIIHLALTVVDEDSYGFAEAGEIQLLCEDGVTLTGNLPAGTFGYWHTNNGAMIENDESIVTKATHLDGGLNVFTWTLSTLDCPDFSSDSVYILLQNEAPTATSDTVSIPYGQAFTTIDLIENDDLKALENWTFTLDDLPSKGIVRENTPGSIDFSAPVGYYGISYFSYELCNDICPEYCDKATVLLRVEPPKDAQPSIIITPNGDGLNETLFFDDLGDYPDNKLVITNRWGSVMYEVKDYQNNWFGQNANGKLLPEGTYYYLMQFALSEGKTQMGSVTVKR